MKSSKTTQSVKGPRFFNLLNPLHMLRSLYHNRELIWNLTKREVNSTYQGSFLGGLWTIIVPFMMMAIYTLVFSVIFQTRWNTGSTQPTPRGEFALILYTGLTAFNVFSTVINRSPGLVLAVPNYVKKVVFPLEILPVVATASAIITSLINVALILAGSVLVYHAISPTVWLLPLVYIPLILLTLGLAWFLSSLGVFIRDIGQVTSVIIQALFFLTPIVYSIDSIPQNIRFLAALNPLGLIIDGLRRTLLWGTMPDWESWAAVTLTCAVVALLGFVWFSVTKKGFADVM